MGIGYIKKLFENHNVCVTGMKGSGKDLLMANIVARRKKPYVSNIDYKCYDCEFMPLDFADLECGKNTYKEFISGNINQFFTHIQEENDIYISDCGIYFPSQYCNELNREFKYLPTLYALYRHTHNARIHVNAQNLNRVWDKIREQSDVYIYCRWAKVLFGKIVIQLVTEYDRVESCLARIHPCRIQTSIFDSRETKKQTDMYLDNFFNSHGRVRNHLLIYINKSNYDTRHFKRLLDVQYMERTINEKTT